MSELSRRDLLRLTALGVVAAPVAGSLASIPAGAAPAGASLAKGKLTSLKALASAVDGTLLLPTNSSFAAAASPWDTYVDFGPPVAILQAKTPQDVADGINYARSTRTPLAVRSGGHNYAGYSTTKGLLISVAPMNGIRINAGKQQVTVGAGAQLINVYNALAARGLMIPAGTCPTVGIAGNVLGGGFGLSSRKFGLLADNLISAQLVLADGRIVTASAKQNPDLFWAIRGSGGGNFGIATSFTFQAHPVGPLAAFKFQYPWSQGRAAFDAWQQMIPTMTPDLTTSSALLNNAPGTTNPDAMGVQVYGLFQGTAADLTALLAPLVAAAGPAPTQMIQDMTFMQQAFYFGGCDDLTSCQNAPVGTVEPLDYYVKSSYAQSLYSTQAIDTLFAAVEQWPGTSRNCMIESFAYGGAVNAVAPTATAFPHRNQLFCTQAAAFFGPTDSQETQQAAVAWLTQLNASMAPFNSGAAYVNYIDGSQANWQQAYYGANLPRLSKVKRKYDPSNLFSFPQSIPL